MRAHNALPDLYGDLLPSAGYAVHQLAQEDGARGKLPPGAGTSSKAGAPAGRRESSS